MTKAPQLPVAIAQINTSVGAIDANIERIRDYAHQAHERGARIVVFPEMTITGYPIEDLAFRATFRRRARNAADQLACDLQAQGLGEMYVVLGTVGTSQVAEDERPTNSLLVLHDGQVIHSYDKQFLPNYGVFDEFRIFTPGHNTLTMDIDGYRLGFAICEDIWQDNGPAAQLAEAQLDVLITINGSPFEENKDHTRLQLCVQRAAEVQAPVVYVNQVGGQDDLVFDGGSFAVNEKAEIEARAPQFEESLIM